MKTEILYHGNCDNCEEEVFWDPTIDDTYWRRVNGKSQILEIYERVVCDCCSSEVELQLALRMLK